MMQRKNKPKPTTNEGISIEALLPRKNDDKPNSPLSIPSGSNSSNGGSSIGNDNLSSSPSKLSSKNSSISHTASTVLGTGNGHGNNGNNNGKIKPAKSKIILAATVKSNTFGTSPFDKHWLNLDCCGIICASLTYMLHWYGVYAFGWILLPPWMGIMDEDGVRTITFAGHFHRALFIAVALLAVTAHFKAMTTDPGAVPPDANPIPDPDELDSLIKGERESPRSSRGQTSSSNNSSLTKEDSELEDVDINGQMNGNSTQQYSKGQDTGHGTALSGVAMTAMGAAAAVGAAGVAVAGAASAAAPIRANPSNVAATRGKRMCRRCHAYKPPRAHHCSICKRCIIKMDHHCPWVNNCVGIGNHKYFLLFIFYTSISCMYSLIFITYRFFHCVGRDANDGRPRCVDHPANLLPLIGLAVEALLFGLFTICMMVDQWDVVMTNLTHIDRLKGAQLQGHPPIFNSHNQLAQNILNATRRGINEVFGTGTTSASLPHRTGFHPTWLSPLHSVCFPETIRDDIFGYCRPCSNTTSTADSRKRTTIDSVDSMEMVGRGRKRTVGVADIV